MLTLNTNLNPGAIGEKPTTQLTGFDFISYCKFNGKYLGLKPTAISEICGNTQNGTAIHGYFETFSLKLGYDGNKHIRCIYLSVETDGNLIITVTADGKRTQVINVSPPTTGRQFIRIPVGSKTRGTYFKFKVENVDGCWYSIDTMSCKPINLAKGIQSY